MASVWAELRRRNVVKVAVAYAIVGWILIEISATVFPIVKLPDWTVTFVTMLVLLGFPVALILSWAFELTPDGFKPSNEVEQSTSITSVTGQKLNYAIIGVLVVAVVFLLVREFLPDDVEPEPELQQVSDPDMAPAAETTAKAILDEEKEVMPNSIAVLPFENMSPNPDHEYFAAGIHEETLNRLAGLSNLSVISRTSVLRYEDSDLSVPEIATELNVGTIMEGSVRYADDRVRITAQLIDAATDEHLWSEVYERDFADIFAIQSDIAMNIANALQAEFSPEEQASIEKIPTSVSEAYSLYLHARNPLGFEANNNWLVNASTLLGQAIELDPEFAAAYALRAEYTWTLISRSSVTEENWATHLVEQESLVMQDLERALELDPNHGPAYSHLARVHESNWRGVEASRAHEQALRLNPNDPTVLMRYAQFQAWTDQHADAIELIGRAVNLAPNVALYYHIQGIVYSFAGDDERAITSFNKALEIGGIILTHSELGRLALRRGDYARALEEMRITESLLGAEFLGTFQGYATYVYALAGSEEDAARAFKFAQERSKGIHVEPTLWVFAYLGIGNQEEALHWLEEARNAWTNLPHFLMGIRVNVYHDPVLDQPEFVEVRERLGFTDL